MTTPSSRHLSHDFPAYKGLTLRELFVLVLVSTSAVCSSCLLIGLFVGFPGALGCVGLVLGFTLAVSIVPGPISRLKVGKPHGYLLKKLKIKGARLGILSSPYLEHQGHWTTSKRIGEPHV
jgi:conjugative transfer region protein (TIGR03750 family)